MDADSDQCMIEAIMRDDIDFMNNVFVKDKEFFKGKDRLVGDPWIINAIKYGGYKTVKWILGKGVSINVRDKAGYTVLHSAIDCDSEDKYEIISLLVDSGAPINIRGVNDYTPAHLAAVKNDVLALKILSENKADFSIRTRVDNYSTPYEEAKICGGATDAVSFLSSLL